MINKIDQFYLLHCRRKCVSLCHYVCHFDENCWIFVVIICVMVIN